MDTLEELEIIIEKGENPTKIMIQELPKPTLEPSKAPPYFTFYRKEESLVTKEGVKFLNPLQKWCDEYKRVHDTLDQFKRGTCWRM